MNGVSVVFVSTDEGKVLIPAIESLLDAKNERPLEVIVVDNASNDGAAKQISEMWPDIKVMRRQTRHGLPANLNLGAAASREPYVMLCNSDLVFGPGSVDALAGFLDEHPRAGMAAPRLLAPDGTTRASARRWYTVGTLLALKGPWRSRASHLRSVKASLYEDWDYADPREVDWVPCPATMVRRQPFVELGMMDERFRLYFDDVDISLRMHRAGWQVWCVPNAEVIHLEQRASIAPFSRAWRWHLISLVKFAWKHKGLRPR